MLLQLRKSRSRFMTFVHGDLVQKGRRGADQIAEDMKRQFSAQMDKTSWRYTPRAKVAVTMHFYARDDRIPDLHHLVKFYLDPLRSVVFNDDRQVGYLAAQCWRPPKRFQNLGDKDARVFIEIERLTDYKRRFDLFYALMELDDFRDHLRWERRHHYPDLYWYLVDEFDDEFDEFYDSWLDKATADFLGLSEETREELRRFNLTEHQKRLLMLNKIEKFDRPTSSEEHFRRELARRYELELLTIYLGGLPVKGKSKQYKQRIRARLRKLRTESGSFGQITIPPILVLPILVPVELDVQITPRDLRLGKDLDNIMRDIAPVFKEELLHDEAYLLGYRIYVTHKLSEDTSSGNIRVKLLPPDAIGGFEDAMDETFTAAEDWLEDKLRRSY